MATGRRYYWLKLKKDFFKRHDIRIVEGMDNGKDYILFYLKLLLESIDHDGFLRFSETVPYNDKMLAVITNTNIDIVRSAIEVFKSLGLMEILDDKTIYLNQTEQMLGYETDWAKQKREQRTRTLSTPSPRIVHQEKEIELDIEIDKEKGIKDVSHTSRFTKPKINEISDYCNERNNNVDPQKFYDFYESKGWMVGKNKMKDWRAAVRTWERDKNVDDWDKMREVIKHVK